MIDDINVLPAIIIGENIDQLLFKAAFHYAESGINVWFISPEAFDVLPDGVQAPEKEVLKLVTFMYLKDYKDLIRHLNSIHLWQKTPGIILLKGFEKYCNFETKDDYNPLQAASVIKTLLDNCSTCATKRKCIAYLLIACTIISKLNTERLQTIIDLYGLKVINSCANDFDKLERIKQYFD